MSGKERPRRHEICMAGASCIRLIVDSCAVSNRAQLKITTEETRHEIFTCARILLICNSLNFGEAVLFIMDL